MRDLHHLLAVLGTQLEEVVNSVMLVVEDSVPGMIRSGPSFNSGKLEISRAVRKIGQRLLKIALKCRAAVLAVNQATDKMGEEVVDKECCGVKFGFGTSYLHILGDFRGKNHNTQPWNDLGHLSKHQVVDQLYQ